MILLPSSSLSTPWQPFPPPLGGTNDPARPFHKTVQFVGITSSVVSSPAVYSKKQGTCHYRLVEHLEHSVTHPKPSEPSE